VSGGTLSPKGLRSDGDGPHPGRGRIGPTLRTVDGVALATRCWMPDRLPVATVVICHGLTGNKDDPRVVALAERIYDQGYGVVTYDARGHGSSGGICTLGQLEERDVAAIVRWAGANGGRLVLVGASMGALGALSYAGVDPSLTGVVTISSPGDWRLPLRFRSLLTAGLARTRTGRRWAKRKMNVRIGRWAAPPSARTRLAAVECPVVVVHGTVDPIIPRTFSLAEGLKEGPLRELVLVPGMGHAFDPIGLAPICGAISRLVRRRDDLAIPMAGA
jgi:pimeloyl-ACP methyl ester carboxylesterase